MVYESILENETYKILWDFKIQTDQLISARRPYLGIIINQKKKKNKNKKTTTKNKTKWTYRIVDFAVSSDISVKITPPQKKRDKYFNLAWELKKLWNVKVTLIPIVIVSHGTSHKNLLRRREELEIRGRTETLQTTAWLGSARILRRVL